MSDRYAVTDYIKGSGFTILDMVEKRTLPVIYRSELDCCLAVVSMNKMEDDVVELMEEWFDG